jgi:hypothetical protein
MRCICGGDFISSHRGASSVVMRHAAGGWVQYWGKLKCGNLNWSPAEPQQFSPDNHLPRAKAGVYAKLWLCEIPFRLFGFAVFATFA